MENIESDALKRNIREKPKCEKCEIRQADTMVRDLNGYAGNMGHSNCNSALYMAKHATCVARTTTSDVYVY